MPGATFVIDQQKTFAGPPIAMTVGPKLNFGTSEQSVTRDGERRWVVQAACQFAVEPGQRASAEVIEVTLTGEDPSAYISPGALVEFDQLRLGISSPELKKDRVVGGKAWYSAAGIRPVSPANGRAAASASAA